MQIQVANYKRASWRGVFRIRLGLLLVQCSVVVLSATALSSTLRNNDQAAYIGGALQLAHGQVRAWAAPFYNYDKQYATYLMVAGLLRLFPKTDPVWLGNLLTFTLFSLSALSICLYRKKTDLVPVAAFIPVILSPALALYAPFLGTSCVSYSILVCAFMVAMLLPGRQGKFAAAPLVALAVASRADAILAVPAFILCIHSRQQVKKLVRDPTVLTLGLASMLPILVGRVIFTGVSISFAGFVGFGILLKAVATLLVFSFGLGEGLLLLVMVRYYARLAVENEHWRTYYTLTALSILIPIGFYGPQLFTPTFFFLQLAVTMFVLLNGRTAIFWRQLREHRYRFYRAMLILLVSLPVAPWVVGVDLPRLTRPNLTLLKPTTFPTSHGAFPMGAYGAFLWRLRKNQFVIDHNQKIWHSAETVDYHTCNGQAVPLAGSPMVDYLELAVRLQHKTPIIVKDWKKAPCGSMYVDSRSVTRTVALSHYPDLRDVLSRSAVVASQGDDGQPILLVETSKPQSLEAAVLSDLRDFFGGRQFEVVFMSGSSEGVEFTPPFKSVIFTDALSCLIGPESKALVINSPGHLRLMWDGEHADRPVSATVFCPDAKMVGLARSVLPSYMF